MTRFIKVSGADHLVVLNIAQIVLMTPVNPPQRGLMTCIATTNSNEDCWCQESIGDILRAMQSQAPSESGIDIIDVAEWAKYHSK